MRSLYGENKVIVGDYDKSLSVKCRNGIFVGKENEGVIAYKGIPFAMPPTGERRWKAPEAPADSDEVREAYYFAPSPIQTEIFSEQGSLYKQSEDCLYLNVWVNKNNAGVNKPVMVFIHGGSYGWGGTSDPLYEGTNFIKKFDDIILVTIAYRTGVMGFLDLSFAEGGEEYTDSCNAGILDQIEALKWVRDNIGAFGGDAENVTVFGESAGGGSVSILPTVPLARGLFKRVIAESGSVALSYSREECRALTEKLFAVSGKTNVSELVRLSERELKILNAKLNDFNNFPMRDGKIIPEHLYGAYEGGAASKVDMIIGTNSDEARYWIREVGGEASFRFATPVMLENNRMKISADDNEYVDRFLDSFDESTEQIWRITEFYNELLFRVPAAVQAGHHAACGGNTYMYYWNYPSAIPNMGACHAVELAYVFNNLDEQIYTGDNIDKELADTVQNMWVNFARTGNPSTDKYLWPKYDIIDRTSLVLGNDIRPEKNLLKEQFDLIAPLMKYKFNGCYTNLTFHTPHVRRTVATLLGGLLIALGIVAAAVLIVLKILGII